MRRLLALSLALVVVQIADAAEKPIPQDKAKIEKNRRDCVEWNRQTIRVAYEKVGKRNPRWDKLALDALDVAVRFYSKQTDPEPSTRDLYNTAKAAVDAGCDDPYIVYQFVGNMRFNSLAEELEINRRMAEATKTLAASKYPAFRRAIAHRRAGGYISNSPGMDDANRKEVESHLDAALVLLAESIVNDERNLFWEDIWFEKGRELIRLYRKIGKTPEAAVERVHAEFQKHPETKVLALQTKGAFWFNYGWEMRSAAFAPNVPIDRARLFHEYLSQGKKALEEAWKFRPNDARTATYLLDIDKSIGGDRAVMEQWFEAAMKADGDKLAACSTKLDWLDPKWHGSPEEMMAFGRACRETGNWWAGITLLSTRAHLVYSGMLGDVGRRQYLATPEIWDEIAPVFDEYLKHRPNDAVARSKYAAMCFMGRHFREAHAQFEILGLRLTSWSDFPYVPLPTLRAMKEETAEIVAKMPAVKKP